MCWGHVQCENLICVKGLNVVCFVRLLCISWNMKAHCCRTDCLFFPSQSEKLLINGDDEMGGKKTKTTRGKKKFRIQHPAWEKSTEMQPDMEDRDKHGFHHIYALVNVIPCASFAILTRTNSQSEQNTDRENGIIIAGCVHTWKICQHNLFMCLAWSEANVLESKTLSTN